MLDLTTLAWYNEVRLGVWGSMGRAKGGLSCHFIKQKKIFNVHFFLAILSVLWHTIPSYERYEHRDQSNQEGDLLHLRL